MALLASPAELGPVTHLSKVDLPALKRAAALAGFTVVELEVLVDFISRVYTDFGASWMSAQIALQYFGE